MMDFAVRELRAIVEGPMVIVRLGSCGSPHADCVVGSTVIADKCIRVDQNVEAVWGA
jgi:uridine phosphorylase